MFETIFFYPRDCDCTSVRWWRWCEKINECFENGAWCLVREQWTNSCNSSTMSSYVYTRLLFKSIGLKRPSFICQRYTCYEPAMNQNSTNFWGIHAGFCCCWYVHVFKVLVPLTWTRTAILNTNLLKCNSREGLIRVSSLIVEWVILRNLHQ